MSTSSLYVLTPIISFTGWLQPRSVPDVGCGYGQWGLLLRQFLDYPWALENGTPRWARRVDDVEAWPTYRNDLWDFAYDSVVVSDARGHLPTLDSNAYDLGLCLEVIEHLDLDGGRRLLRELSRVCTHVVVSTPDYVILQDDLCGNPFERHRAWWSWRALKSEGAVGRLRASGSTVALFSSRRGELRPWLRGLGLRTVGPLLPPALRRRGQYLPATPRPPSGPTLERSWLARG
jgi:SAM-dependent methyltransferase